jgi:hypothetical protein
MAERMMRSSAARRSDLPLMGFVVGLGVSGMLWAALAVGLWLILLSH